MNKIISVVNGKYEYKSLGITQQEIQDLFYLQEGELFWRNDTGSARKGDLAGYCKKSTGYWIIVIGRRCFKRARLVWLYVTGEDAHPDYIDHINRNKTDDRIENLRKASISENNRNRNYGKSKYRYVYWEKDGNRWSARVSLENGKRLRLGRFSSEEEAAKVVENWKISQAIVF